MADLSVFQMLLVAYLALAFAKTVLCYASADIAIGVFNRRFGRRHQFIRAVSILIVVPVAVTLCLLKILFDERLAFFVVYNRRKVMRDMLIAF